jgi:hypothetical protein
VNIGVGKFLRDGLTLAGIESAFRRLVAGILGGWSVEHNEDGTHGTITVDGITITDDTTTGGTIASNLVPAVTNTYDIGRASTEPTNPPYGWRKLRITSGIEWVGSATNILGQYIASWTMLFAGSDLTIKSNVTGQSLILDVGSVDISIGGSATIGPSAVSPAMNVDASLGVTGALGVTGHAYANTLRIVDGVTAPSAVSGFAIFYVDTADGDLKVVFGNGTVKTIATNP